MDEQVDTFGTQEESGSTGLLVEDVEMPKAQTSTEEPAAALSTGVVDKKLEETLESQPALADPASTNGAAKTTVQQAEEAPVSTTKADEEIPTPQAAIEAVDEEIKEPEKPQDPTPTPSATDLPSIAKPATPIQPAAPPKNLTWASRVAAAAGPKPVVPVVAPKTSTPPSQTRASPAAKTAPAQPGPAPAAEKTKDKENAQPDGWQTAGSDHMKRQNRPQSVSGPPEKEGTMGYVRNVTEKVTTEDLRAALSSCGQLIYFDVNRSKVSRQLRTASHRKLTLF